MHLRTQGMHMRHVGGGQGGMCACLGAEGGGREGQGGGCVGDLGLTGGA